MTDLSAQNGTYNNTAFLFIERLFFLVFVTKFKLKVVIPVIGLMMM